MPKNWIDFYTYLEEQNFSANPDSSLELQKELNNYPVYITLINLVVENN
jgi:hypothetical protein